MSLVRSAGGESEPAQLGAIDVARPDSLKLPSRAVSVTPKGPQRRSVGREALTERARGRLEAFGIRKRYPIAS